nr:hypothetical protein [Tanacetum cinerariifolium]
MGPLTLAIQPSEQDIFILVDNRPWLEDLVSKPAHLWQLMVIKSRFSPFAITRGQKDNKEKPAFKKLKTSFLVNSKLHRTLNGFVVFKVTWDDVWGINYVNELQEFDSIAQAAKGLMSWFPRTLYEALLLKHHLNYLIDVNDCVKTSYDQMESDELCDDNSMDDFDQKELSKEYYTKKFRKVNKEDRRDDDKLRRQVGVSVSLCYVYQGNVIEQHIFPSGKLSFNRTGIIEVSFTLGSQGFSSPKGFNTCTFIAENYLNFLS